MSASPSFPAGIFALFCLLLFVGAVVHSRCVLILFSVFGLFSIILLWLLSSIYVATAIALGDFCSDPTPWVMHVLYKNAKLDEGITSFYLRCPDGRSNPFDAYISVRARKITCCA